MGNCRYRSTAFFLKLDFEKGTRITASDLTFASAIFLLCIASPQSPFGRWPSVSQLSCLLSISSRCKMTVCIGFSLISISPASQLHSDFFLFPDQQTPRSSLLRKRQRVPAGPFHRLDKPKDPECFPTMIGCTKTFDVLNVMSDPVGREIWIDGQHMNDKTNGRLSVPFCQSNNRPTDVLVRMPNRVNCTKQIQLQTRTEQSVTCQMPIP